jgi:hypothetical protein
MEAARVDSAYAAWQEALNPVWTSVLRAEAASKLGSASAIQAMRDSVAARPFELTATFDNERGPDFSALFEEAPVIERTPADSARLRAYALKLKTLLLNRNGRALYEHVRIADQARRRAAPGGTADSVQDDRRLQQWVTAAKNGTAWFDRLPERTAFQRSDLRLERWCDGRVWEVGLTKDRPLFGGWHLYVAEVGGELRVVRGTVH